LKKKPFNPSSIDLGPIFGEYGIYISRSIPLYKLIEPPVLAIKPLIYNGATNSTA